MSNDIDLNIGDTLKIQSGILGAVSPDHTTYNWRRNRMLSPEKDPALRNLIGKRFMSTASTPMRHTFSGDFGIQQWGAPQI